MNILKRISFKDANGITVTGTVLSAYNAGTVLFPDWCVEFTRDTAIKGYGNYCNLSQVRDDVTEVKLWREGWVICLGFRSADEESCIGGTDWYGKDSPELAEENVAFAFTNYEGDEFTYFSLKAELPFEDRENYLDTIDTYTDRYVHGFADHKLHWFKGQEVL